MARETHSFRTTESEEAFLMEETERTNTNISTVIRQLIRNAMEEEEREDQIERFKAELGKLEKISLLIAKNAIYEKHIVLANYGELVKDNQRQIEKMKNKAKKLTKEEMESI